MSTKIEIVVDYSDGLKSITVDNIDMDNISYIAKRDIKEWNTPSGGRPNWKGLIEEIKALVADDVAELVFDFRGSEEHKSIFRQCFGDKIDGLDEGEFVSRRTSDAQKAEHIGDYSEALENYMSIADRCAQVNLYYQAADYAYSIYIGERNCELTGNVELLRTYCDLCDKAFTIVKASQDATLALEAANKANFIFSQTAFSGVIDIDDYIDKFIKLLEQAGNQGSNDAKKMLFGLYKEGSYVEQSNEKAFEWLLQLGDTEGSEIQLQIADYYFEGGFIEQNLALAFIWYTKSANNGNATAAARLAICYEKGLGCEESYKDAFYWYSVASESGDVDAQFKKAIMLYDGQGTIENKARALGIFSELAEQGNIEANYWCGYCHEQENNWGSAINYYRVASAGEHAIATYKVGIGLLYAYGCEKDETAAYQHFIRSAEQNYEKAIFMVAECKRHGIGCNPNIEEAKTWYHRSTLEGNSKACNILGEIYEADKKLDEAVTWYLSAGACSSPSPKAKCNLGRCYYYGIGVEIDYQKAEELFIEAINGDDQAVISEAKYYLGIANEEGNNSKGMRLDKAFSLFIEAANSETPYAKALYKVAICYQTGKGTQQDEVKAWEYYIKASENGYPEAQYLYASKIVNSDLEKAIDLFTSAAEQGHLQAQYALGNYYKQNNQNDKAQKYLGLAASKGHMEAAYELGCLYEKLKQKKSAQTYYKMAAGMGHVDALYRYGKIIDNAGTMLDDKDSMAYIIKAADKGSADAQYHVGKYCFDNYLKGNAIARVYLRKVLPFSEEQIGSMCVFYLRKAANQGNCDAMKLLGDIYATGYCNCGIASDTKEAMTWYSMAIDHGDVSVKAKLQQLKGGKA